jgi:hypothetical protein
LSSGTSTAAAFPGASLRVSLPASARDRPSANTLHCCTREGRGRCVCACVVLVGGGSCKGRTA